MTSPWHRRGTLRLLPFLLLPLCLALALGACGTPRSDFDTAGSDTAGENPRSLSEMLAKLREDTQLRETAVLYCAASLTRTEGDDYEPFMASFFDVPRRDADLTLCRVIVEAVVSEELTQRDVEKIERFEQKEDFVHLGAILRKLLLAQERLDSQQVERPPLMAASPERPRGEPVLPLRH